MKPMRMRLTHTVLVLAVALAGLAAPVRAQDAQRIVEQYVKAAGGAKALARIQTLTIEGVVAASAAGGALVDVNSKPGTYTIDAKLPNRYYSEFVLGEQSWIEAYNGKSAWHQNAAGEIGTLLGAAGMQLEAAAQIDNSRLVNLKKSKLAVAFIGHAQVRGKDALQVEITTATGVKREIFFDPQTHRIVKDAGMIGGVDEERLYDDYRAVDGVSVAHAIELRRGSETYRVTVTRVAVNARIGESVFDFPRKSQVHLPDLKELFREIDSNQKAIDKIRENYAGTRTEEETEYESNGKVKRTEEREETFFYLNGREVSTLVKKNGKPLSEAEQKKENERVQKRIEELQKRDAKKEAKEDEDKEQGKEENSGDDVNIETFLRACQFVNARRERFRGQDVLVFDFEPNPEFKAHTLEEKLVQKLAGVVWIDEKAHDVVRLEAYFVGDLRIAGGLLASVQRGTSFVFEQAYVNNEVWLPTYEEAHVAVRVLLVKGLQVNEVTRYSDYKKFRVETLSTP